MARLLVALAALAVLAGSASAQLAVCDPALKVGGIKAITMKSTAYSPTTSNMVVAWDRPADGPKGGLNSCISEYVVDTYEVSASGTKTKVGSSATVAVSPAHASATFEAKNLKPNTKYSFYVYGRNPKLGASGNGAGLASAPFTSAPAPAPPAPKCKQPQAVSNIRRVNAVNNGAKATVTIAWNKPQVTPTECYSEYVVGVYEAGSTKLIRQATVKAPTTTYTDSNLEAGKKYEFTVYARNPAAGAMGNGISLKSEPIMAPVGVTAGH